MQLFKIGESMYYLDNKLHHLPHIQLKYNKFQSVFSIPEGNLLNANLLSHKIKLIKGWL